MKLKHLFTTVFAAVALITPAFAEDDTPLSQEMDKANKALKIVNRSLVDPSQKDANLAKLAEVKAAFEKSLTFEPAKAKSVPTAEKAKFIADYKAAMQTSLKTLEDLKAAIQADKHEDAAKAMEKLQAEKKDGHKAFKAD